MKEAEARSEMLSIRSSAINHIYLFEVPKPERSFIGAALPQYYANEFNWFFAGV
jgi:hypothetical protein